MKCSICGQQCGLFKSYHEDCKSAMIMAATKIYSIINRYENGNLACGKMEMIELIKNEPLYRTYLMNQISGKDQIYNNEIILYVEKNVENFQLFHKLSTSFQQFPHSVEKWTVERC